ncbi:hypothetical protein O1611_g8813 [Lasiodiplodia mahajangana]|uniref:Uncharacterized protein n=1 Tax=Lasiodiplodia mahajangana TaxID=1108764 RepID=A0ACC2JBJ7_9PEZI|nr:hypothetical protein O1611_g8813 [Lasiodiplodia mahajangana]
MVAVRLHSPEVVKLLIEYGADPRTPMLLHSTASASSKAVNEAYPNREDSDRIGVMKVLLEHGANVNEMEPDPKSRPRDDARRRRTVDTGTPLHYAVAAGNPIAAFSVGVTGQERVAGRGHSLNTLSHPVRRVGLAACRCWDTMNMEQDRPGKAPSRLSCTGSMMRG